MTNWIIEYYDIRTDKYCVTTQYLLAGENGEALVKWLKMKPWAVMGIRPL